MCSPGSPSLHHLNQPQAGGVSRHANADLDVCITRGEQTAAALEANLTSLESKLDELLASLDIPDLEKTSTPAHDGHQSAEDTKGAVDGGKEKDGA